MGTDADQLRDLYAGSARRLVGILTVAAAGDVREAEDVVQEAFVRLLSRWPAVGSYDDPEAWVRSVAFRLLANRRRRGRNSARALLRLDQPQQTASPTGDRLDVVAALAQLPLAQRQVVVLHHLVDLPVEQVAAELRLPVGTVKSRLARARQALAPLLEERVTDDA